MKCGFVILLLALMCFAGSFAQEVNRSVEELELLIRNVEENSEVMDKQGAEDDLEPMNLTSELFDESEFGGDSEVRRQLADYSDLLYAIPYEAGVEVIIGADHLTHSPAKNRIDMSGVSGGPYKIVAAASGVVKYVVDDHNVNGGCANNNYVWIAHSNGEWTKYSHLAQNSASVDAGLKVGDNIKMGQFVGIESDIGCASGPHLHWEVGIPDDLNDPIVYEGGWVKGTNLIPRVCGIAGNVYVQGETYKVPSVRPGWAEYSRHGLPHSQFQADFLAASRCGYRMEWNDGFGVGNTAHFNVVYRPNKNPALNVISHRMLTKAQLTQKKAEYTSLGYRLVHIDTYNIGNSIRYAAIFYKGASVKNTITYHGVSAAEHQNLFGLLTNYGYHAIVISPTSASGTLVYSGVYRYGPNGGWVAKSYQTSAQYQTNYNSNKNAGRRLIYLNCYVHNGQSYYSAIWSSTAPSVYAKHDLTNNWYQYFFNQRMKYGWSTAAVCGMRIAGVSYYGAFWEK